MRLYNITVLISYEPSRTSYWEVLACVQPLLAAVCLRNVLFTHFPRLLQFNRIRHVIENFLLIVPFGFVCFEDIFADWVYLWTVFYFCFVTLLLYVTKLCHTRYLSWQLPSAPRSLLPQHVDDDPSSASSDKSVDSRQYRAIVYIATVLCILGRDLNNFRLLFAKSYVFGTALMDVGVGCFVVSMGMSGPTVRPRPKDEPINKRVILKKTLNLFVILMAIGIIKLILSHSVTSNAAVEEYGVHWNVFMTLAMIKILGTALELSLPSRVPALPVALAINVGYEIALERWLKLYIVKAERTNWFSKNREGLCQLFGLQTLYVWGLVIGRRIFNTSGDRIDRKKCTIFLFTVSSITCICGNVAKHYKLLENESRRTANFSYTLWMVTYTTCLLGEIYLIGFLSEKMWRNLKMADFSGRTFLTTIDRHGFTYFLIANLMTGAIVIAVSRRFRETMSGYTSLFIMVSYGSISALISTNMPPVQYLLNFRPRWSSRTISHSVLKAKDEQGHFRQMVSSE